MSFLKPANGAEAGDRLAILTALGAGAAALVHSINVFETLTGPAMAEALGLVQLMGGVLIAAVFAPLFVWFKLRAGAPRINPWKSESFFGDVARRAGMTAFAAALLSFVVMSTLDRFLLSRISAEVMLDIAITLLLGAFALAFLIHSAGPSGAEERFDA